MIWSCSRSRRATAVLSEDEKDLGICLIDIGGGTTDLAIWTQGAIRHTSVIPDRRRPDYPTTIAMALRTPTREARGHQVQVRLCALRAGPIRKMCSMWPASMIARRAGYPAARWPM